VLGKWRCGSRKKQVLNEIVVLVGIPGSGKSTLATTRFAPYTRINLDTLKTHKRQDEAITRALENGENVIVDNTNVTESARRKWIEYSIRYNVPIRAVFVDTTLDEALLRNRQRQFPGRVPEAAVRSFYRKLEQPRREEGFSSVETVRF
jgi:predicted kinase